MLFYKLLLLCALVHGVTSWWWFTGCSVNSQCSGDKCCLRNRCKPLGSENNACSTVVYIMAPTSHNDYCPCGPRLHCKAIPKKPGQGTCQPIPCKSSEGCQRDECCSRGVCRLRSQANCEKSCTSAKDCGRNECCRSRSTVKGRKKRASVIPVGTCEPFGNTGSDCLFSGPQGPIAGILFQCPCQKDLTCENTAGGLTVPITLGTCTPKRKCFRGADCRLGECCHLPNGPDSQGVCELVNTELKGYCEKGCISARDCGFGECCQSPSLPKGRRKRLSYAQSAGSCKPLGNSGSQCVVGDFTGPGDGTQFLCPCHNGLSCQDGQSSVPLVIGTCQVKYCNSGNDCDADECCVSVIQPVGRKKRALPGSGTCGPLGSLGSRCLAGAPSGQPSGVAISCPCKSGLTCAEQPIEPIVLPNFQNGICEAPTK